MKITIIYNNSEVGITDIVQLKQVQVHVKVQKPVHVL